MMSQSTIRQLQQDARERAALEDTTPYLVAAEDIEAWKRGIGLPIPFPMIGDYEPPGYETDGDALFIDTSGYGAPDEPALTVSQMLDELKPDRCYAFTEVGQFQAYLQPYRIIKYRHARKST
jgi:hypothetical protein